MKGLRKAGKQVAPEDVLAPLRGQYSIILGIKLESRKGGPGESFNKPESERGNRGGRRDVHRSWPKKPGLRRLKFAKSLGEERSERRRGPGGRERKFRRKEARWRNLACRQNYNRPTKGRISRTMEIPSERRGKGKVREKMKHNKEGEGDKPIGKKRGQGKKVLCAQKTGAAHEPHQRERWEEREMWKKTIGPLPCSARHVSAAAGEEGKPGKGAPQGKRHQKNFQGGGIKGKANSVAS